jgi:hypothetical protein
MVGVRETHPSLHAILLRDGTFGQNALLCRVPSVEELGAGGAQVQSTLWIDSYAHLSCCLHNCWFTRHSSTWKCAPAHAVCRRSAASIGHFCHFRVSLRFSGRRVLCGMICLKRAPACFQSIRRTLTNDNKHLNLRSSREVIEKFLRSPVSVDFSLLRRGFE